MDKLKEIYKNEFNFLKKDILKIFFILLIVFILFATIITFVLMYNKELSKQVYSVILNMFTGKSISTNYDINMALDLFINNIRASGIVIISGIIPFLMIPILFILLNSLVMGGAIGMYSYIGLSPLIGLVGIIPHGIFEIPAYVLAGTLGVYLNISLIKKIIKRKKCEFKLKEVFINIIKTIVLIIVPLLIIAALIEAFLTIKIMDFFLPYL